MKIGAIIQTRMGSSRLPGKVMVDIEGKTVISHVIERVKQSKRIDEVIIATTTLSQDDIIVDQAEKNGVQWFRGSEDDVLSRYYGAAKERGLDIIVRITSDCPLIDPFIIDKTIEMYLDNKFEIVTNAGIDLSQRTFPRGLDNEVFSFTALEQAYINAKVKYQREHVTPYIYEHLKKGHFKNDIDYSAYRWTLDTDDDLELIKTIYGYLYKGRHDFYFQDIIALIQEHPEISKINEHVEQKKLNE